MSIDERLNDYREAKRLLQEIINKGVKSKDELIDELRNDLKTTE